MILHVDPASAVPPYDQIRAQVQSMADPALTNPSIVFVPHSKGKV